MWYPNRTLSIAIVTIGTLAVLAQPSAAQWVIRNDATGGDCQGLLQGQWNAQTKTCTLTMPKVGTIDILSDEVKLDGGDQTLTAPPNPGWGIRLATRKAVQVTNVRLTGFKQGILVMNGHSNRIRANQVSAGVTRHAGCGICLNRTSLNWVQENTLSDNEGAGIELILADRNLIEGQVRALLDNRTGDAQVVLTAGAIRSV